jgi:hypothetical protein
MTLPSTATTQNGSDNSTNIATTAFVKSRYATYTSESLAKSASQSDTTKLCFYPES